MVIQIQISDEVWNYLNKEKKRGETFNEVFKEEIKKEKPKVEFKEIEEKLDEILGE